MSSIAGTLTGTNPQRVRIARRVGADLFTLMNLEATLSEGHLSELEVTDHPVETGSDITDHVRLRPVMLDVTAVMSNRPISLLASQNASLGIKGGSPTDRAEDSFREMLRWQGEGLLLVVETKLRTYEDVVLQRLAPTRDAATGRVLNVQMTFREIITAETQIGDAPVTEKPQDLNRKNKGSQAKKDPPASVESAAVAEPSLLVDLVNGLAGVP